MKFKRRKHKPLTGCLKFGTGLWLPFNRKKHAQNPYRLEEKGRKVLGVKHCACGIAGK